MSFKISLINGLPVWDSLPVAKIVNYPLEKRDYKPFVQARLCRQVSIHVGKLWGAATQRGLRRTAYPYGRVFGTSAGKIVSVRGFAGDLLGDCI